MNVFGKILTVDRVLRAYAATGLDPAFGHYGNTLTTGCALTAVFKAEHEPRSHAAMPLSTEDEINSEEHVAFTVGFDSGRWHPAYGKYPAYRLGRQCRSAVQGALCS